MRPPTTDSRPGAELGIRALNANDADAYRAFRLFMLEESPTAFSADLEETARRPLAHFVERTRDDTESFIMGAFSASEGELVGSAGGLRDREPKRRHLALVWGMYVRPDHRGLGLGRRLLDAVLERLDDIEGVAHVQLGVTAGNEPALMLYESAGFRVYGREPAAIRVAGIDHDELLMSRPVNGNLSRRPPG